MCGLLKTHIHWPLKPVFVCSNQQCLHIYVGVCVFGTVKLIVAGQEAGRQACGDAPGARQCWVSNTSPALGVHTHISTLSHAPWPLRLTVVTRPIDLRQEQRGKGNRQRAWRKIESQRHTERCWQRLTLRQQCKCKMKLTSGFVGHILSLSPAQTLGQYLMSALDNNEHLYSKVGPLLEQNDIYFDS